MWWRLGRFSRVILYDLVHKRQDFLRSTEKTSKSNKITHHIPRKSKVCYWGYSLYGKCGNAVLLAFELTALENHLLLVLWSLYRKTSLYKETTHHQSFFLGHFFFFFFIIIITITIFIFFFFGRGETEWPTTNGNCAWGRNIFLNFDAVRLKIYSSI